MKKTYYRLPLRIPFFGMQTRSIEIWNSQGIMVECAPFEGLHTSPERYNKYLLSELDFFCNQWPQRQPIPRDVLFYGLLTPDSKESDFHRYHDFSVIKVKCARHSLGDNIRFFNFLCRYFPRARFRVDANRIWSVSQLQEFNDSVDAGRIEYFEEPTPRSWELTGDYPIAFDETAVGSVAGDDIKRLQSARAIVIKPHLFGSIQEVLGLIEWAQSRGISVVLSALFNSSVGDAESLASGLPLSRG